MKVMKKMSYFLFTVFFSLVISDKVMAAKSVKCVYKMSDKTPCFVTITATNSDVTPATSSSNSVDTCAVTKYDKLVSTNFKDVKKHVWKCPPVYYDSYDLTTLSNKMDNVTYKYIFSNIGTSKKKNKMTLDKSKSTDGTKYEDDSDSKDNISYCNFDDFVLKVNITKKTLTMIDNKNSTYTGLAFTYETLMNSKNLSRDYCPMAVFASCDAIYQINHGKPKCLYYLEEQQSNDSKLKLDEVNKITDANGDDASNLDDIKNKKKDTFEEGGCGFIGPRTLKIVKWGVKIIRISVPILIVIFGISDFLSALFAGEDKTFKEALNKFLKRLLAGVILLFVPYILMALVKISGVASDVDIDVDDMFCAVIDD